MECKVCSTCLEVKALDLFVKSKLCKSGYRAQCKTCFNLYYAKRRVEQYDKVRSYEKKFHRARRLKYDFGITEEVFKQMVQEQQGKCAICLTVPDKILNIDHCHTTGKVRGLLCRRCNTGIGQFKDNPEYLTNAITYLGKKYASK